MNANESYSDEQIEAYVNREMPETEQLAFKAAMEEDGMLVRKVKVFELERRARELAVREDLVMQMKTWETGLKKEGANVSTAPRSIQLWRRLSIAAGFLLLVGFAGWFWLGIGGSALSGEDYLVESFAAQRGLAADIPLLQPALQAMQRKNYPGAIEELELISDPGLQLEVQQLLGECYFRTGELSQAIAAFKVVLENAPNPSEARETAEWYLLVTYWQNNDDQFKGLLESLVTDETHLYHRKALQFQEDIAK